MVKCVETQQVFSTLTAAAKFAGIGLPTLHAAASRRCQIRDGKVSITKTAGGYHWEYVPLQ